RVMGPSYSGSPIGVGFFVSDSKTRQVLRYKSRKWRSTHFRPPGADEEVLGIVEPEPHLLFYTTPTGLWRQYEGSRVAPIALGMWRPTALTADLHGNVFALSGNG